MSQQIKIPDAIHSITIDADPVHVVVRVGSTIVAATSDALILRETGYPPVHYVPLEDVVPGVLRANTSISYCPYKGEASYYDIVLPDGRDLLAAVWTYRSPYPAVTAIAGRVAFYTDRVQLETQ